MIVIPAIDVLDHKVVQLIGGTPGTQQVVINDVEETAKSWVSRKARYLHLVDLDAAFGKGDNIDTFCNIIRTCGVPCEVGGGIRSEEVIRRYVEAGADRVIVGTRAVTDIDWLADMARKFPGKIVVGMDMKDGKVVIKGWQEDCPYSLRFLFDAINDLPVTGVLYTDVNVEGRKKGVDEHRTKDFVTRCPKMVIASGGITTYNDAVVLSKSGAIAAVVGMAVYDGTLEPWKWELPWVADYS